MVVLCTAYSYMFSFYFYFFVLLLSLSPTLHCIDDMLSGCQPLFGQCLFLVIFFFCSISYQSTFHLPGSVNVQLQTLCSGSFVVYMRCVALSLVARRLGFFFLLGDRISMLMHPSFLGNRKYNAHDLCNGWLVDYTRLVRVWLAFFFFHVLTLRRCVYIFFFCFCSFTIAFVCMHSCVCVHGKITWDCARVM